MKAPYNQIIDHLDSFEAKYEVLEHEPTHTSEQSASVVGHSPAQGAKALVLKDDSGFVLCVVRGSNQLDYKKVRAARQTRKIRFATPDEVFNVMRVRIGACYPFGHVAGIDMLVDASLAENESIVFSPGTHEAHIVMPWAEYIRVNESPVLIDLAK